MVSWAMIYCLSPIKNWQVRYRHSTVDNNHGMPSIVKNTSIKLKLVYNRVDF